SLAPIRILKQILALQLLYYLVITLLLLLTLLLLGQSFSPSYIFRSPSTLRFDTTLGWTLSFLWLLTSLIVTASMPFILGRSKLVLDFALTLHFLHVLVTAISMGEIPWDGGWWLAMAGSAAVMVFGGRAACRWWELR
ncbi:integral membrane protein S linking to the trans Golgi network-domain-containing protein, partial [Kalaharituber pfeilii]